MNDSIKSMQKSIDRTYTGIFGRTPLRQRLRDINKEATELDRYTDLRSLKGEAGDLLTTLIQLCNENEWPIEELVDINLKKIRKRKNQYKALGRKTQVAILGGAFNPITVGHIQVAKLVLDQSMTFDEVYIMPCYKHIYNKKLVAASHRLEMCRLAAKADGRIKVFDYEIVNKLGGETYNLAKRLLEDKKYSDTHSFSFIIGLDNANTFDKWVSYEELEKLVRFVVVPRTGEKPKRRVNWYLKPPHMYIEPDQPLIEISSTSVRENITSLYLTYSITEDIINNPDVKAHEFGVDPNVLRYILEHKLYTK